MCDECGLYINLPMTPEEIKKQNKNFMLSACRKPDVRKIRIDKAHSEQLDRIESYISSGKVYDVGASGGFFLKAARDRGWTIAGNDVSPASIDWAKKNYDIDIDYGVLEELEIENGVWQAVVLWNSLEHTHNPATTLQKCVDMLCPGGILAIKVPNNQNAEELNKYYERVHLFEFTDQCMRKHLSGLNLEELYIKTDEIVPNHGVRSATYICRKP